MKREVKKTRWVKKGHGKSKGYKKTGRTRKVHNPNKFWMINVPKGRLSPIEDCRRVKLYTNLECHNLTPCVGGVTDYFNFCPYDLSEPFQIGFGTTYSGGYQSINGASPGGAMTINPDFAFTQQANYVNLVANMFQRYRVEGYSVEISGHLTSGADTYECCSHPNLNFAIPTANVMEQALQSSYAKHGEWRVYYDRASSNTLKSGYIKMKVLAGKPEESDKAWQADPVNFGASIVGGSVGAPTTTSRYMHQITWKSLSGITGVSALGLKIRLMQDVIFYDPIGNAP